MEDKCVQTNAPCESRGVSARVVETSFLSESAKTSCCIRAEMHQFIHCFDIIAHYLREEMEILKRGDTRTNILVKSAD